MLVALTYYLAGIGVRERSLGAAIAIFLCFTVDRVAGAFVMPGGGGNPVFLIAAMMLLISNIRGTILARGWSLLSEPVSEAEFPDRANVSFGDRFANYWPRAIWPSGQFVFYPLAAALLLLTALGLVRISRQERVRTVPTVSGVVTIRPQ